MDDDWNRGFDYLAQNLLSPSQGGFHDCFNGLLVSSSQSAPNVIIEQTASNFPSAVPSSSSVSSTYIQSSLQARHNWPGNYNFSASFGVSEKNRAWTYCTLKDKLYIRMDDPCPVNFSVDQSLPLGVTLRAMAMFSSDEDAISAVKRCHQHSFTELQEGKPNAEHLIRCDSEIATYEIHPVTQHLSVTVPWENPLEGEPYSTYIFRFACLGSCRGGPNRRPLKLVFTLENDHQVIGRRTLDLKICACPSRDCMNDEKASLLAEQSATSVPKRKSTDSSKTILRESFNFVNGIQIPTSKKKKESPNERGVYTIRTRHKETYEFLQAMDKLYDLCICAKTKFPGISAVKMEDSS